MCVAHSNNHQSQLRLPHGGGWSELWGIMDLKEVLPATHQCLWYGKAGEFAILETQHRPPPAMTALHSNCSQCPQMTHKYWRMKNRSTSSDTLTQVAAIFLATALFRDVPATENLSPQWLAVATLWAQPSVNSDLWMQSSDGYSFLVQHSTCYSLWVHSAPTLAPSSCSHIFPGPSRLQQNRNNQGSACGSSAFSLIFWQLWPNG